MAKRVLLVDQDVDALAALAAKLRERGIRVSLANGSPMACERARVGNFDVVLASPSAAAPTDGSIGVLDALSLELPEVPPFHVLEDREDVDAIVARISELARPKPPASMHPSLAPSAHALEHAALADLLLVLGTERRSGTLTVTTGKGSGEVRLVHGDMADAVYVRLEGVKAITRMIGERDGTATFTPGAPAIMRRMHEDTKKIVAEARALADRARALREAAGDLSTATLMASEGASDLLGEIEEHVLARLRVPAALDELLDELPHSDAALLESVIRLDGQGRIKRIGHESSRVQLCGPDQLHLVRASAARAKQAGFKGPARLVFAATPSRLAIFGHTILSLADAYPSQEPAPAVPVPWVVGTIRLGDGVELDVVALPLVPAYAPLWPMALAGSAVVVRLDEAASDPLEQASKTASVPILDARAIFGEFEESSAVQVASLVKTALEVDGIGPS